MSCLGRMFVRTGERGIMAVILIIVFALILFRSLSGQSLPDDSPLVKIDSGMIRGMAAGDLLFFKGIPFARPPVGDLRWRPPQPVKPWSGVRSALVFGPDPMQPFSPGRPEATNFSEDCLYLNICCPVAKGDKPLPVFVWIYGGGLVRGGSSIYPLDVFARHGIVSVSFNYRLGRLGFFAHPAFANVSPDDLIGNYGYMDQIAALQWVQRNIAAFGGDPNHVTIAGESAGGGSVLVLLTSPLARGLFQRAILESPGIPTARAAVSPMHSLAAAESIAAQYAHAAGIEGNDLAAVDALRALPAEKLVQNVDAYVSSIFGGPEIPGLSHCMIDGRLVVEPPETVLRAGRQAMVPVLVGANDYDLASGPDQTKDELFARFGSLSRAARKLYDPDGNRGFKDLFQAILADENMIEPSRHLAELVAAAGQPAYFYRFSYVPETLRSKFAGAPHALELPFVFEAMGIFPWIKSSAADQVMACTINGYWVDFVKTGDPNGGGRPVWPRYNPATREVLDFTDDGVTNGPDPLAARLNLWQSVWDQAH